MDKTKKVRYVFSVFMVMLMVGIAEWTGEKEIIFPEMAALAVGGLAIAVALTVREVRRARGGSCVRTGFAIAAGVLYLASVPYLVFFIWLWFVD